MHVHIQENSQNIHTLDNSLRSMHVHIQENTQNIHTLNQCWYLERFKINKRTQQNALIQTGHYTCKGKYKTEVRKVPFQTFYTNLYLTLSWSNNFPWCTSWTWLLPVAIILVILVSMNWSKGAMNISTSMLRVRTRLFLSWNSFSAFRSHALNVIICPECYNMPSML